MRLMLNQTQFYAAMTTHVEPVQAKSYVRMDQHHRKRIMDLATIFVKCVKMEEKEAFAKRLVMELFIVIANVKVIS